MGEQWFLTTYHTAGNTGILVLKSLAYITGKGEGDSVQISRDILARHSGRSIRTVSRAIARLKALSLLEAAQPIPHGFDCWKPNIYRLTALGRHVAALLGSGSHTIDFSARAICDVPISLKSINKNSDKQTSMPPMAHVEMAARATTPRIATSCDRELEPILTMLERTDATRFKHIRDWVSSKLRAGISCRQLQEALEALLANLDRVQSWAGWIQSRLEDLGKAERDGERRRQIEHKREAAWRRQREVWLTERTKNSYGPGALVALVQAQRGEMHLA